MEEHPTVTMEEPLDVEATQADRHRTDVMARAARERERAAKTRAKVAKLREDIQRLEERARRHDSKAAEFEARLG